MSSDSRQPPRVRIREGDGDSFGIVAGSKFTPLSNFAIKYLCEVRAGPESGFVVEVTLSNGQRLG